MPNTKPFVHAAAVCERILLEADGVPSLIRIVDVILVDLERTPKIEGYPPAVEYSVFIGLKSGDVKGKFQVGIRLCRPEGIVEKTELVPVEFQGGGQGNNIRVNATLINPTDGLHWIDVLWSDEILTRIPLEIRLKQTEKTKTSP